MDKPRVSVAFLAAFSLLPAVAVAAPAVTTQTVNMRAGPDASYPKVATLGRGVTVDVLGCVDGWQWCDVTIGPNRGFVAAGFLSYRYASAPVVIAQGGPTLGIPLVAFSIAPYWDSYYRGRPWWNDRARWYGHRVAPPPVWHAPPHYSSGHDDWHRNDGRGYDTHGDRDRNGYPVGNTPGPYTRSEGGRYERPGGSRPNDSAHPNAQQ